METRLAEIESRLTFQDQTIQQLNDVVTQQAGRIELLQAEIDVLKQQMDSMSLSLLKPEAEETPPPHY
jgi:SlyX protein